MHQTETLAYICYVEFLVHVDGAVKCFYLINWEQRLNYTVIVFARFLNKACMIRNPLQDLTPRGKSFESMEPLHSRPSWRTQGTYQDSPNLDNRNHDGCEHQSGFISGTRGVLHGPPHYFELWNSFRLLCDIYDFISSTLGYNLWPHFSTCPPHA